MKRIIFCPTFKFENSFWYLDSRVASSGNSRFTDRLTFKKKFDWRTIVTTCGIAAGVSSFAAAQTAAPSSVPVRSSAIEEILVTGQKRIENIQDVPKSVDVKTQEDFDKSGVTQLSTLANAVPSISSTAPVSGNGSAPAIRGIKTITQSVGVQSKTGVMVDEIAQPTFSTLANELVDVERVEVFAGPQSTLSGRNAAGGVISITTRSPSQIPEFDFSLLRTNDDETSISMFGTGPLADSLAFSLSSYWKYQDGQTYSPEEGKHIGDLYRKGARGKLQLEATDNLTATLTTYYIEGSNEQATLLSSGNNGFVMLPPSRRSFFPLWDGSTFTREVYSPEHGYSITRDRGISLTLDYDFENIGTFSSLTNFQKSDQKSLSVLFGEPRAFIPNDGITGGRPDFTQTSGSETKFFSQEVRLVSEEMDPWTYLVGAIYSRTDLSSTTYRPATFLTHVDSDSGLIIDSAALFSHATYSFSDTDSLTMGLRYQYDKNDYDYENTAWERVPRTATSGPRQFVTGGSSDKSNYGFWGAEASYKHYFAPSVNAYITLARTESGEAYDLNDDVNGRQTGAGLIALDSEVAKNIEIGLKSHLFDDRVTFNIAAFLTKYDNYQMQATDASDLANIQTRTYSIGKVETRGVELTTAWQATEELRLDFNAALTDAVIKEYPGAPCYANYQTAAQGCTTIAGQRIQDLSGSRMPDSPRVKYTFAADYTIFLPNFPFDGNVGAFYRHQSETNFDPFGNPYTEQEAYGVTNVYAGINSRDDKYRVKLFVNNVFDKQYYFNLRSDASLSTNTEPAIVGSAGRESFRYAGIRFDAKFK